MKKNKDEIVVRNPLYILTLIFVGLLLFVFCGISLFMDANIGAIIITVICTVLFVWLWVFKCSARVVLCTDKMILENTITKAYFEEKWENFNYIYLRAECHEYHQNHYFLICSYKAIDINTLTFFYRPYVELSMDIALQLKKSQDPQKVFCFAIYDLDRFNSLIGTKLNIELIETNDLFGI